MEELIPQRIISVDRVLTQLQQQIELASKLNNYSFLSEIAIENFLENVIIIDENNSKLYETKFRNHINSLLSYLIYLFESNTDANKLWLIHQMILKFVNSIDDRKSLDEIICNTDMIQKINLLADGDFINLSMICNLKLTHLQPHVTEFYKKTKQNEIFQDESDIQPLCIKLRNALYQDTINVSMVLSILSRAYKKTIIKNKQNESKLNIFDKIYSQGLIHALKNQNKQLMMQILLRCPDCVFNDENLVKQIIDCFFNSNNNPNENDLMSLYSYSLFCSSCKLIQSISLTKRKFFHFEHKSVTFFDLKQCFLLAVQDQRHFLREFIDYYYQQNHQDQNFDLSIVPFKSQIVICLLSLYNIINNYEDFSQIQGKISNLESNLCQSFNKIDEIGCIDRTFMRIIEKHQFVFKFADWCYNHINSNNTDRFNFRYEIIAQLMTGNSPLKILSNHDFFELKMLDISFKTFKEEIICDYVCDLIEKFDKNISMILKGFIVIRLVIFCIFSKTKENIYFDINQVQTLLRNIYPIDFRLEIMENLFSLLFLTKNDLKMNYSINSEDEDYLDETISSINTQKSLENEAPIAIKKMITKPRELENNNFPRTTMNFVCPNWLIPKLLEVIKDMLYKTNSDLFQTTKNNDKITDFAQNLDKLKNRINVLLKYVSDAQFRYDVIRPAFFRNVENLENSMQEQQSSSLNNDDSNSNNDNKNDKIAAFSTSSDTDNKNHYNEDTSLICCMLASPTQLLCYTLTENRLDSSRQIAKLFENELKNSKPYKELQILDYFTEFHNQVNGIRAHFSNSFPYQRQSSSNKEKNTGQNRHSKFKINEITSLGIRSSRIQSLLYEMLMKMDPIEIETKIIFMLDYALSSSPSLEITQSILESVFIHNNNLFLQNDGAYLKQKKILPEKIENFVIEIQKFIKNLSQHFDISDISMSEYLERSLTTVSSSLLDTQTFVDTIKTQIEMCRWYHQFYSLLMELESQIIFDPNSILDGDSLDQAEIQNKSQHLNYYYDKLMNHCPVGKYQYLKALYMYVRKVNKALVECRKRNINSIEEKNTIDTSIICSTSHFSILKQSPSAILCSMVIKRKISPKIIDDLAQVMKVNLIGVLCSVFCPTIPSTYLLPDSSIEFNIVELCQPSLSELIKSYLEGAEVYRSKLNSNVVINDYFTEEKAIDMTADECMDSSFQPIINQDVLNYFYSKCPTLVEILRLLNLIDESQIELINQFSPSLQVFHDSPLVQWIELIRKNFNCDDTRRSNSILAFYPRIPAGENVVTKVLEHHVFNKNYLQVYKLFQFIEDFSPDNYHSQKYSPIENDHRSFNRYQVLQNAIYSRLAFIKEDAKYVFQIVNDPKMKAELILYMLDVFNNYEETFYATRLIRLALQSIRDDEITYGIDASDCKSRLEMTLKQIEFYASVGQLTGLKTWKLARNNLESIDVLTIIKTRKRYSLAIDWYEIRGFENDTSDLLMELMIYAYSELNDYSQLARLFQMFLDEPKSNNVIVIVEKILNQADNLDLRTFLIDFFIQYYRKRSNYLMVDQYERYKLGVEIVKLLSRKIQQDYIDLIPAPLLLIEQLLMNSEIEALDKVIHQQKLLKADELIEKYAQKSVYIELIDCNSFDGSDLTVISSESSQTAISRNVTQFVIPSKIPSKEQWVSDTSKTHCMLCQVIRFSMINRRHHCRRCGRVVCNGCSTNNLLIQEINPTIPVRVCDDCFNWCTKTIRKTSTHSIDSSISAAYQNFSKRTQWKLVLSDETTNQNRRNEFSYESAPSVSLCLAILRLHSDKTKSCKFIIDKICAPLIENTTSRNVDSTLLIEMIRSLLISTRLAFEEETTTSSDNTENDRNQDSSAEIEQLNLYLDRLDVIRMFINANCGTKEIIGYVLNNNIQKLQEKLLEAERFELTIDIAKKYGIESSPIWKSWALICLKHCHFVEARQKFIRYFDQVKRYSEVQKTLKMIIETLVSINKVNLKSVPLKDKCSQIIFGQFDFLTETNNGSASIQLSSPSSTISSSSFNFKSNHINLSQHLKPRILQEIVYYLETFGTKDDQLSFYVEHFYWKEAIECFQNMANINNRENLSITNQMNVNFLQKIFIPAQVNGHLNELFAAIRICDPQQTILGSCLISICKYLNKNNFYHCLYRVQVFMNDYLRAAITQINHFFLNPTNEFMTVDDHNNNNNNNNQSSINLDSYALLFKRINHLEKARDYCNMYLHNMDYVKIKQGCLVVDKKDVFKQIRLIELQIDILKRFNNINNPQQHLVSYPITVRLHSLEELEHYLIEWPVNDKPLFLSAFVLCMLELNSQSFSSIATTTTATTRIQIGRLSYPPTLLEHDSIRKSLITSLIILYYNVDDLADGFRQSLRIIQDHHLDAELVYKMATMFLVAHHLERNLNLEQISNDLKQLLTCIHSAWSNQNNDNNNDHYDSSSEYIMINLDQTTPTTSTIRDLRSLSESSLNGKQISDDIIVQCLRFIEIIMSVLTRLNHKHQNQISFATGLNRSKLSELKECLIKLISDDNRRIEAYLHVGKLKLAYLLAASVGQATNIRKVLEAAKLANDLHYVKICEMWLKKNDNSN